MQIDWLTLNYHFVLDSDRFGTGVNHPSQPANLRVLNGSIERPSFFRTLFM